MTGWTFGDGNPATIPTRRGRRRTIACRWKPWRGITTPARRRFSARFRRRPDGAAGSRSGARRDLQSSERRPVHRPAADPAAGDVEPEPGLRRATSPRCSTTTARRARRPRRRDPRGAHRIRRPALSSRISGKLSEPVLFVVSQLRALNATVTDHPFMSDKAEEMGQKVFYPRLGVQLLLAGLPRARHGRTDRRAAGRTGVPDPDDGDRAGARELRRRAARRVVSAPTWRSTTRRSRAWPPIRRRSSITAPPLHGHAHLAGDARRRSLRPSASRRRPARVERSRTAIYLTLVAAQSQVDW